MLHLAWCVCVCVCVCVYVCVSLSFCVGHMDELYKNGWNDWDRVWIADSDDDDDDDDDAQICRARPK